MASKIGESYRHDRSLFRNPPYVDVYATADHFFDKLTTLKLGTLLIPAKKWPVFEDWSRRLTLRYDDWQQHPKWISAEQYKYHGWHAKTSLTHVGRTKSTLKPIHISKGKRKVKCDVPCFWPEYTGGIIRILHIDELNMEILMSMEGEKNHNSLALSDRPGRIMATTRFDSVIPMPYFHWPWTMFKDKQPEKDPWSTNNIQTPHLPFSNVKKAGIFIARNCASKSKREDLVRFLMRHLPIDSVSSCLNNVHMTPSEKKDKGKMMRRYAFYLAFENEITKDYITEKLWWTFSAGVLPIYFGAPNANDHVPEHSMVNVHDYPDRIKLVEHLKQILNDEALYDSYHAWRYKPLPESFIRKYNFTHVHSECRTCRWAAAKVHGLGWDHEQQNIIFPSRTGDSEPHHIKTKIESAPEKVKTTPKPSNAFRKMFV